jgi:hypothetical protein
MNPQQEQNNANPQPSGTNSDSFTTPPTAAPVVAKKRRTGLALLLLIGPSALIILAIIIAAVSNFVFSATAPSTGDALYPDDNPVRTIVNVIVFLMGTVTVITWLPGIIIGIILLNKK